MIGAGGDGIAVSTEGEVPVADSTLRASIVVRSGQDGIQVATSSTDIRGNRAVASDWSGLRLDACLASTCRRNVSGSVMSRETCI